MILFRIALFLCAISAFSGLSAQKPGKDIKAVINRFFEGLAKGDTVLLKSACTDSMLLQTVRTGPDGRVRVETEDFQDFVRFVGAPRTDTYLEKIKFGAIHVEKTLASVWTPYVFYLNGKIRHCGTNSFQLVNTETGWKIQYIIDTRRKDGCQ